MIKFNKTEAVSVKPEPASSSSDPNAGFGVMRPRVGTGEVKESSAFVSEANSSPRLGAMPNEIDIDPMLKDIIFSEDLEQKRLVNRLYRDIYYNDAVGGSAVDLVTSMIVSDITLGGIASSKADQVFNEAIERLNIRTLMPAAGVDYLVDGAFTGSLMIDKKHNKIFDIMPHRSDNCKFDSLPFFGQDPVITSAIPQEFRTILMGESNRAKSIRGKLGDEVISQFNNAVVELDPLTTVYMPRRAFSTEEGVSWFRRILPLYLIEKNLYRGTLVESSRRQRGILHITLGDGDMWQPTVAEMNAVSDMFVNADSDPLGAIIATRLGITTEEIRQGGDFWKVTDIWDSTAAFKMRSLGLSESLLSGEANMSTVDASMTVFVEWLRTFRDYMTSKMLYNKIFPLISMQNGYTVNSQGKMIQTDSLLTGDVEKNLNRLNDSTKLLIPTVHWARQLKPEGDTAYMDMLNTLSDKGVPVPVRALAAAGGFNLDAVLADSDENLAVTKRLFEYSRKLHELKKEYGPAEEGDDSLARAIAAEARADAKAMAGVSKSSVLASNKGRHVGLLNRDFGEQGEIFETTATGKKKYIHNQKAAQEKANKAIIKAMDYVSKNKKTPLTHTTHTPKGRL